MAKSEILQELVEKFQAVADMSKGNVKAAYVRCADNFLAAIPQVEAAHRDEIAKLEARVVELELEDVAINKTLQAEIVSLKEHERQAIAKAVLEESEWWAEAHGQCDEPTEVCRWIHERLAANRKAAGGKP